MASHTFTLPDVQILKVTPGKLFHYTNQDFDGFSMKDQGKSVMSVNLRQTFHAVIKLNLGQLKLTKTCVSHIKRELRRDEIFIKLKWLFSTYEEFITSPEKLISNKIRFDFTSKFRLEIDPELMPNLDGTPINFELYAVSEGRELLLSKTHFFMVEICEKINSKSEGKVNFLNKLIDSSSPNIATLDIWYKFVCNPKYFKSLYLTSKQYLHQDDSHKSKNLLNERFISKNSDLATVNITSSECDGFADGLFLVLNRNKVLKTTQSEISNELQERVRWLRYEANWKQTLQENAILHGKNPEDVIWRQWREEDTANVRLRTYSNKTGDYKPEFVITVVKLFFFPGSAPLRNDSVQQIYVEYSFLNLEGPDMETPFSMPKPKAEEDIVYNFTKAFPIDLEKNYENCKLLANLIKTDGKITFNVVNEPYENYNVPIQTCNAIGYAEVQFNELTQLESNEDIFEYEIMDSSNNIEIIGFLTIKLEGILAMRRMALLYLAPKDYKLYM